MEPNQEHLDQQQEPEGVEVLNVVEHLTRWKTYALYALIAVVLIEGGVIVWQRANVAEAKLEVAKKDKELQRVIVERDTAKHNDATCRLNMDDQNKKIEDAGKRYNKLKSDFDQLKEDIKNGKYYKNADDVRNKPTPKTCEEALDFLNGNF